MKKLMLLAFLGMLFIGAPAVVSAQGEDSTELSLEEPKDTISIDNMDPVYYEEEETKESSNGTMYAIIGGIVVIGGAAYFFMKKKK
jgi:LPXTG-motif cell wall-anchored protein